MFAVEDSWEWDVPTEIEDDDELAAQEDWEEEVKFWGYRAKWPEKSFSLTPNKLSKKGEMMMKNRLEHEASLAQIKANVYSGINKYFR